MTGEMTTEERVAAWQEAFRTEPMVILPARYYQPRSNTFWYGLVCGLATSIAIAAFIYFTWLIEMWSW